MIGQSIQFLLLGRDRLAFCTLDFPRSTSVCIDSTLDDDSVSIDFTLVSFFSFVSEGQNDFCSAVDDIVKGKRKQNSIR